MASNDQRGNAQALSAGTGVDVALDKCDHTVMLEEGVYDGWRGTSVVQGNGRKRSYHERLLSRTERARLARAYGCVVPAKLMVKVY